MSQYGRKVSLIFGDAAGNGLDVSDLHIKFTVRNATVQSLKRAEIRVYNLAANTVKAIQKEFTHVFLQAGYEDNIGLIFSGTISKFTRGRENATDTFLDIVAADADEAYNFTVASTTLAAGWKPSDQISALVQSFSQAGVSQGFTEQFDAISAPRGKVIFGMARDYMRVASAAQQCEWYIDDGKLNVVSKKGTLPGQAVVLTSKTGMIGVPQQTVDGLIIQCLLNPNIRAGGQIKIDNESVTQTQVNVAFSAMDFVPSLDADGFYKVACCTHIGDTRGPNYQTEMICIAVDGTAPITSATLTAVPEGQ